jgi:hypothetical protein
MAIVGVQIHPNSRNWDQAAAGAVLFPWLAFTLASVNWILAAVNWILASIAVSAEEALTTRSSTRASPSDAETYETDCRMIAYASRS